MSNKKEFKVTTTKRMFFRQYLELMRSFYPLNKLRTRELDVLGELLYYNDRYKSLSVEDRAKIMFDENTRTNMREVLDMSSNGFNNNLSVLRKQGVIRDNIIAPGLVVFISDDYSVEFKFTIDENSNN